MRRSSLPSRHARTAAKMGLSAVNASGRTRPGSKLIRPRRSSATVRTGEQTDRQIDRPKNEKTPQMRLSHGGRKAIGGFGAAAFDTRPAQPALKASNDQTTKKRRMAASGSRRKATARRPIKAKRGHRRPLGGPRMPQNGFQGLKPRRGPWRVGPRSSASGPRGPAPQYLTAGPVCPGQAGRGRCPASGFRLRQGFGGQVAGSSAIRKSKNYLPL